MDLYRPSHRRPNLSSLSDQSRLSGQRLNGERVGYNDSSMRIDDDHSKVRKCSDGLISRPRKDPHVANVD